MKLENHKLFVKISLVYLQGIQFAKKYKKVFFIKQKIQKKSK